MSEGPIPASGASTNDSKSSAENSRNSRLSGSSDVSRPGSTAAIHPPVEAADQGYKPITPESSAYLLKDPKLKEILLSDVGVDALLARLKQSIYTVKEVSIYIKKMATIEAEHSSHLKKVSRSMNDAFKRPEVKKGTCQNQVLNMMKSTDRYGDAGVTFIDTMHKIHEELNEVVRSMDRTRKSTKETALRHEKTLLDAEREVEKAKAKYDAACEELEKARTSDPNRTKLGFKSKSEDELHRRMVISEVDYQQKVDNCQRTRQELMNKLRVGTVHKLQGLILECDNALSLQLIRFSNLFETLQLNRGFVIAPLKPQNASTSSQSIKEMAGKIDSELDFYNFVCSIAKSKTTLNRPTATFKKHPALGPAKPHKASVSSIGSGSGPGGSGPGNTQSPGNVSSPSMGTPRQFGSAGFGHMNDRKVSAGSAISSNSPVPSPSVILSPGTAKTGPVLGKSTNTMPSMTPSNAPPNNIPSANAPSIGPTNPPTGTSTNMPPQSAFPLSPADSPAQASPTNMHPQTAAPETAPPHVYDPTKHGLPVYGTPLEDLLDYEEGTVPRVVYQCVQAIDNFGLEVEGIYRMNGNKDQISAIRQEFDIDAASVDLLRPKDGVNDIHSVASALKQYFQALPDPLLTEEYHQQFLNAANITDEVRRRDSIHAIINNLPDPNYTTLRYLVFHLYRVQERSGINKMDVTNLGIVWGPVLMKADYQNVGEMAVESRAVQTILANAYAIFEAE